MMEKARRTLESTEPADYDARDITGITVAINPKQLSAAKKGSLAFAGK